MLEEIIKLRRKGLSFRKIAVEIGTTVGKVQYQWVKYQKSKEADVLEDNIGKSTEKEKTKQVEKKGSTWSNSTRTSLNFCAHSNNIEAWLVQETKVFVFWRIPPSKYSLLASYYGKSLPDMNLMLKIYDITSIIFDGHNAHSVRTKELTMREQFVTVDQLLSNRSYCFEIGLKQGEHEFLPLLRSNSVHTPRVSKVENSELSKELVNWRSGKSSRPNWIEHMSTYKMYERTVEEEVKKK